jgi:hypothetical protein
LEYLSIDDRGFNDDDLVQIIEELKELKYLSLPINDFTGDGFRRIGDIKDKLIFLDASSPGRMA